MALEIEESAAELEPSRVMKVIGIETPSTVRRGGEIGECFSFSNFVDLTTSREAGVGGPLYSTAVHRHTHGWARLTGV